MQASDIQTGMDEGADQRSQPDKSVWNSKQKTIQGKQTAPGQEWHLAAQDAFVRSELVACIG